MYLPLVEARPALRDRRRAGAGRRERAGDGGLRVAARAAVRAPHVPRRLRHAPARARGADRPDRRLADAAAARPEHGRRDARGRGRAAARPARPARGRCSRPPTAALARSAPRSSSTRRSTRSSARCAGCCPFDRIAIVLSENGVAQVMAVAGAGADEVLPPGSAPAGPRHAARGAAAHEPDRLPARHERRRLPGGGRAPRARPALPARDAAALGRPRDRDALARARRSRTPSAPDDIELAGLLGRLVASAVQNIRAYEGERKTVEELRRLSALRADFVSLVSHELRSPMAAVIGAARTLQQRWRELSPGAARVVPRADRRRDEPARRR